MGYFTVPSSATGHQHANKAVLDALREAGSGAVISETERSSLDQAFTPPPGTEPLWNSDPPATVRETVSRLAVLLAKHLGTLIEPNP